MSSAEIMPASSTSPEREWSLLLTAGSVASPSEKNDRIRSLVQEPLRWPVVLELADRHGVTPLLHQALSGIASAIPSAAMSTLQQRCQTNIHKSLALARELIRILDCIDSLGVEALPYKGLALAEAAYGDMALRQSGDIDILILAKDLPRIREAMRDLGYLPHLPMAPAEERAYLLSGYECAFDGAAGRHLLELQWALQPRFYAVDFDMNGLFRRAVAATVAGRCVKTPSPEDLLLILSLHAAKHVWGRLIWLCDIARIVGLPNLRWDWIQGDAKALGVIRILRVTLLLANRLLGVAIPAAFDTTEDDAALGLADEMSEQIPRGTYYNVESVAYFRLMMRLRERPADRLRFLRRLVFTPGPGEWQTVRLPAALFPLYHVVRLSRLAARLARA